MKHIVLVRTKIIALIMLAAITFVPLMPTAAAAAGCDSTTSFTLLPAWYKGLNCQNGAVQITDLRADVLKIVMNLIEALFYIVGYVSLAMIIWGGFKYMMFGDNQSGIEGAKKTIQNAIIGLVISIFAVVIVNVVAGVF